jgi:hypothetical protein
VKLNLGLRESNWLTKIRDFGAWSQCVGCTVDGIADGDRTWEGHREPMTADTVVLS